MFDIGWSELLVIGVVALIVIGPKDLPEMFRTLGRFTARARAMAREFQATLEAAAEETGVKDVTDDLKKMTSVKNLGLDSVTEAARTLTDTDFDPEESFGKIEEAGKGEGDGKKAGAGKGRPEGGGATTKKTSAKKISAKKTPAKKTSARKTSARKTATGKTATGKTGTGSATAGTRQASAQKSAAAGKAAARKSNAGKSTAAGKTKTRAGAPGKKGSAATAGATGKADS